MKVGTTLTITALISDPVKVYTTLAITALIWQQWKSAQHWQSLPALTLAITALISDCSESLHNFSSHHSDLWLQWKSAQHLQSPLWSLTAVEVCTTPAVTALIFDCSASLHNTSSHRSNRWLRWKHLVPAQLQQSPELLMGGGRLLRLSVASFCRNRRTSFKSSISCWSNICRSRSNFTARKKATPSSPACVHQMQAKDSGTPLQHSSGHQKELLMSSPFILKQVHERQAGATFHTVCLHHNIPYKGRCLSSPQYPLQGALFVFTTISPTRGTICLHHNIPYKGRCLSSPQYPLQGALFVFTTISPTRGTICLHHNIPYKGHYLSSPQYPLQGALKPRSTTGPNDRNGIENRHIAHFQFLVLFIKQLNIWKLLNYNCECCHFVPNSLCQWHQEQGQNMCQKYQIWHKPILHFNGKKWTKSLHFQELKFETNGR